MEDLLWAMIVISLTAVVIFLGIQNHNAVSARYRRLRPRHTLFEDNLYNYSAIKIASPATKATWQNGFLFITSKQVVAYPKKLGNDTPLFDIAPHQIEGFWRPTKYEEGDNTLELHGNVDGKWTIIRAKMSKTRMFALVRALKQIVSEDITRAYRQRRPYIYREPETAQLAKQNIHGAWELEAPFRLYLMPSALVFLDEINGVERMIPLRDILKIAALRRLDAEKGGLVRFSLASTGETVAITVEDYEAWGKAIAIAARRTLEEPLIQKQKKSKESEEMDDYEIADSHFFEDDAHGENLIELDDWHDGEIIAWQPKAQS